MKAWKHHNAQEITNVSGVLYRGDEQTKYSRPNKPFLSSYRSVIPRELAVVNQLPNEEEASQFMLKSLDFDENARSIHPTCQSPSELQQHIISPERHNAYEGMWNSLAWLGCVANTAMWLYL